MAHKLRLALVALCVLLKVLYTHGSIIDEQANKFFLCSEFEREGGLQNLTIEEARKNSFSGGQRCPAPTMSLTFNGGKLSDKRYDKMLRGEMRDDGVYRFILFYSPLCEYSRLMHAKVSALGLVLHGKVRFYTMSESGSEDPERYPMLFKSTDFASFLSFQYVPATYLFKGRKMIFKIDGDVSLSYLYARVRKAIGMKKVEEKELMPLAEAEATLNGTFTYLDEDNEDELKRASVIIVLSYVYVAWEVCYFVYRHFIRKSHNRNGANNGDNMANGGGNDGGQLDGNNEAAELFIANIEQQQQQ